MESSIIIQLVHGGFILTSGQGGLGSTDQPRTEVFVSQGKLIKAIRGAIETQSLLSKKADDADAE